MSITQIKSALHFLSFSSASGVVKVIAKGVFELNNLSPLIIEIYISFEFSIFYFVFNFFF